MDNWERFLWNPLKVISSYWVYLLKVIEVLAYFFSFLFPVSLVYEHGFMLTSDEVSYLRVISNVTWLVFLLHYFFCIVSNREEVRARFTLWTWILSVCLFFTLLPVVFHKPEEASGVLGVWNFFHSPLYRTIILFLLSLSQLSSYFVRLLGKRTNPSLILSSSFLLLMLVGAGLLMLPRATYHGISWVDALFTSTSAVCVTGLVTLDVATTFTREGQIVLMLLIQIGGLGVMTLTSFFAMFFMGNTSLYSQLVVRDMVSSKSLNSLLSTLVYILGFTLFIEALGMLFIWLSIHDTLGMTLEEELFFSAFHSVSAFCNAGFSTLPGNLGNDWVMGGHTPLYIVVSFLIILGGIGFPILVNLSTTLNYYIRHACWKLFRRSEYFPAKVHLYDLNTRIVFYMTVLLVVGGTVVIALLEWNHALQGLPVWDKWVHAFFNSVCPRTAGFCSISLPTLSAQSLLFMILLMVIGGGTQSTAGGVKVNVFTVILVNLWAVIRGRERPVIMKRELSDDSVRRSNAALLLYAIFLFVGVFTLSLIEPHASLLTITFECVSALSTVGSSLDFTPTMSTAGKLLVILMMFIGRVGALTFVNGLIKQEEKKKYRYPSDNIIIN